MQLISNLTMLTLILTGAAVIREREHGTLEHLLVMPVTTSEIMLAKIWANGTAIVIAATLSLWIVVGGMLGVPISAGSTALFVFCAALAASPHPRPLPVKRRGEEASSAARRTKDWLAFRLHDCARRSCCLVERFSGAPTSGRASDCRSLGVAQLTPLATCYCPSSRRCSPKTGQ